jgi:hypothetical protein
VLQAQDAPERIDGRFTAVYLSDGTRASRDRCSMASSHRHISDCRDRANACCCLAPDRRRFEWVGPGAPEWGAAIAFPESQRIVLQGRIRGSDAGDPRGSRAA